MHIRSRHEKMVDNHKRSYPNQPLTREILQTLWSEAELMTEFEDEKRSALLSPKDPAQPELPGLSSNPPGDNL
jgi:hypothetical protein